MAVDVTVKVGGEAGQGIQTVGDLLALVCRKAGFYVMAINDFESRIRGGHSFFQIRISDKPVLAPHHRTHLLVALGRKSLELHEDEIVDGGIALLDGKEDENDDRRLSVPIEELAVKAGGKITSNTVAAGAALSLLGAPFEVFEDILKERFGKKGDEVIKKNLLAAKLGYEAVGGRDFKWSFEWKTEGAKGALINGSKAIALGALAADCRFAAFYPMSPATGIMTNLAAFADDFPLFLEQAEDEIAAVNMIIGASFAGVRSMTSTSGGGFCLMTEGLGLAGITETPIVIVNAQRPGPATGLPTRTAQGDLLFVINASQDEFPRFVFAPGTPAEAFEQMVRAFHLADKYQVPAIVLTDQTLNDSLYIAEQEFTPPDGIEKFIMDDSQTDDPSTYRRFKITDSGVSPRALPCKGKSMVVVSGNEHREDGHISEAIHDRLNMVNKRNAKVPAMLNEMNNPELSWEGSDIMLVGFGSSKGPILESVNILRSEGFDIGCMHIGDIWPFKADNIRAALSACKRFFTVEQNSTAQLGRLIKEQTGLSPDGAILKYDGRPFFPQGIADDVKTYVS
jgi:2-oxoglutarate/2-oxoacid ferredoxin oxidoreductase subunit alpha